MDQKQLICPAEGGRNPGCYLEMVNRFLSLLLVLVYSAENTMALAGPELFAFVQESDCT